jgi:peroxiredoxin
MEDSSPEVRGIMTLLQPGTPAPDFSADASDGRHYRLRELLKDSRVLLVFYPGNNTPG